MHRKLLARSNASWLHCTEKVAHRPAVAVLSACHTSMSKNKHQDKHSTTSTEDNADKNTKRHVYVEPGVQIQLADPFRTEYKTAQGESTKIAQKQLLWTRIGSALVFVYVLLTLWIAYSANRSAESAVIDQRPYVVVKLPGNLTQFVPNTRLFSGVTTANVGRTPAVRIHQFTKLDYFPTPNLSKASPDDYIIRFQSDFLDNEFKGLAAKDKEERGILDPLHAEDALAPGGDYINGNSDGIVLTDAQFADVRSNNPAGGALFLVGLITYTDNSDLSTPLYKTEFCWYLTGQDVNTWRRCRFHNVIR